MVEIEILRKEIDEIDDRIKTLFVQRMALCEKIGVLKAKSLLPVNVSSREEQIISRLTNGESEVMKKYVTALYSTIFEVSKDYQQKTKK